LLNIVCLCFFLFVVVVRLHERCPVFLGSKEDVEALEECYKRMDAKAK